MEYVACVELSGASGSAGSYQFYLNNLYDPDYSGTGYQPRGFDQIAALYQKYAVEECDWEVTFVQDSTVATAVSVMPCDASDVISPVYANGVEQQSKVLGSDKATPPVTIRGHWSAKRAEGVRAIDRDSLQAAVNAGPSDSWFLTLAAGAMDSASSVVVKAQVRLRYHTKFLGRPAIPNS
jgi:hypothetical protein